MSNIEKVKSARDALKQRLLEKVDQLDDFLTQKTRRIKVSKLLDECTDIKHQIAEKTAKLTESESEAVCKEATDV